MAYCYRWRQICDAIGLLLAQGTKPGIPRKELLGTGVDVAPIYFLGGLPSSILIPCVFIRRVEPLLARLDLATDEIKGYSNSTKFVPYLT